MLGRTLASRRLPGLRRVVAQQRRLAAFCGFLDQGGEVGVAAALQHFGKVAVGIRVELVRFAEQHIEGHGLGLLAL